MQKSMLEVTNAGDNIGRYGMLGAACLSKLYRCKKYMYPVPTDTPVPRPMTSSSTATNTPAKVPVQILQGKI